MFSRTANHTVVILKRGRTVYYAIPADCLPDPREAYGRITRLAVNVPDLTFDITPRSAYDKTILAVLFPRNIDPGLRAETLRIIRVYIEKFAAGTVRFV